MFSDVLLWCSLLIDYLLLTSLSLILTNSYNFDMIFSKNIPLWLSLMLVLLPLLYILLIAVCLHCMSFLCSLSILLKRIFRLLTISYPSSFNHSALHLNLALAVLFFSLAIAFLTISSVTLSI